MYRCLHILDGEWAYQALTRLSADTILPVANWSAMSSRDADEGRWNQDTQRIWILGTGIFHHLLAANLYVSCSDFTGMRGCQDGSPSKDRQAACIFCYTMWELRGNAVKKHYAAS